MVGLYDLRDLFQTKWFHDLKELGEPSQGWSGALNSQFLWENITLRALFALDLCMKFQLLPEEAVHAHPGL